MVKEWHSNLRSVRETGFDQILFGSESLLHDVKDAYNIWALSIRFDRINKRNLVSVFLQRIHHQLHATKSDASLEFLVLSQLKLIGLKTLSAVSVEEARWLATMVMLSSAMVSRVLGPGEHILSTVMIWGGAASNQSPMADTFSRIVPRVLCFGEHLLSTVIIWEGAISNHELDIPDLFPIPQKKYNCRLLNRHTRFVDRPRRNWIFTTRSHSFELMQRAKPEMKTASKSHSLSSAAPNSVCVSKIQRQEENRSY